MDAKPHLKTTNFAFRFERKKCCTERERERARDREQHREQRRYRGYLLRFRILLYFVFVKGAALEAGEVRSLLIFDVLFSIC